MAKLTKPITGVPDGEIYPRVIPAGEDCPASLVTYAQSEGAFDPLPDGNMPLTLRADILESPEFQAVFAEMMREAKEAADEALAKVDERSSELEARSSALDLREADLDAREADLAARLAAIEAHPSRDDEAAHQAADEIDAAKGEAAKPKGRAGKAEAGEPSA
ncbi:hypothetical protein [Paracoccus aminophilus]|uniref:Uncharacterized protein n=1 Tax=Paracoccus aminophilus JCM 7686 TaxID=1367847 RepID=S5Y4C6_PARAH|nr:hypothetical protein [Paracoccus aminophilus]AGT08345.1 hypothetical protein JCM7686_1242 [Paracoccus aminophilus JCM 7686]AGT10547.1 hypothetical protein JCM7686_2010 [Paracoccus aminophilus JCM 7686]AGT10580.1 hypothetical protein JCM7686_2635 [Paracoccus aminophilus JCM 7686]